jgi:hypothetical protein
MLDPAEIEELASKIESLFVRRRGRLDPAELAQVAAALGLEARVPREKGPPQKPLGDSNMPDLIGTTLAHALREFEWRRYRPVSDDGVIVHRFEPVPGDAER